MLDTFREQGIVAWFFALEYEAGEINLNNLPLNAVTPNFVAIFVFFGTASSFIKIISSSETETNREAILFLFGCSEVNSTWLITSELANQRARKVLFTCVVFTNTLYSSVFHCITLYSPVFFCILLYSLVFPCILLYPPVFPCIYCIIEHLYMIGIRGCEWI